MGSGVIKGVEAAGISQTTNLFENEPKGHTLLLFTWCRTWVICITRIPRLTICMRSLVSIYHCFSRYSPKLSHLPKCYNYGSPKCFCCLYGVIREVGVPFWWMIKTSTQCYREYRLLQLRILDQAERFRLYCPATTSWVPKSAWTRPRKNKLGVFNAWVS